MDGRALPCVLIIGDSISLGYTPYAERALAGRARLVHHEGNSGDSANVLRNLDGWLAAARPQAVHFNVGLHDLRFWVKDAKYQVPLAEYRRNLAAIVERLRTAGVAPIWATITPVVDAAPGMSKDFPRKDADVAAYNAAALEAVRAAGIPVNDLYALVSNGGLERTVLPDGVHLTAEGYAATGAAVARFIRKVLDERGW